MSAQMDERPSAFDGAGQPLERKDSRAVKIAPGEILCFMCVRNESLRLPYALSYYRRLGITEFFIVENNSTDDTLHCLLAQPDVHVWHASGSFRNSRCGTDWIELLLRAYGVNHWCLIVDADELLCYPGSETRRLQALCADLDRAGNKAFFTILLDMYSDKPIKDTHYQPGEDFVNVCPFFDRQVYHYKTDDFFGHNEHPSYFGGLRQRVFGGSEPGKDEKHFYCVNKIPLIKYDRSFVLSANLHWTNCRELGEETGCLLHFKYFSLFVNSAGKEAARGEHWNGAIQYAQYERILKKNPELVLFSEKHSVRFRDSRQLIELKIMRETEEPVKLPLSNGTNGNSGLQEQPVKTDASSGARLQRPPLSMQQVRNLIRSHKKDTGHPHLTGSALLKVGRLEDAAKAFRRSIELDPEFSWSHHSLGEVLALQQKWGEAMAAFRRAIELNPHFARSHTSVAELLMREGKTEQAVVEYRTALQLQPDLPNVAKNLARALVELAQNHVEEAKQWYREAHRLNPDDADIYRDAVSLRPVDPDLCVQLADALVARHQPAKAIFFYQLVLMTRPDDSWVLIQLAKALKMEQELDQALTCCRRAILLNPDQSAYYRLLAELLSEKGDMHEATLMLERAVKLEPTSSELLKRLGDLLAQQGRIDEASVTYQRAIELGYKNY